MKRKTKIIGCGIAGVIVVAGVATGVLLTRQHSKKYISFIDLAAKQQSELIEETEKSKVIDAYTFSLNRTVCDEETGIGYAQFAITKRNGKPEAKVNKYNCIMGDSFGEKNRFGIKAEGSYSIHYRFKENTLYADVYFEVNKPEENKLYLVDYYDFDNSTGKSKEYEFAVNDSVESADYQIDEQSKLTVSALGVRIKSIKDMESAKISIHFKEGSIKVLNPKQSTGDDNPGIRTEVEENHLCTYLFTEPIELEEIDYIECNDKKIEKM